MTAPHDSVHELWNWKRCESQIRSLHGRLGFPNADVLKFLGLSISLRDGSLHDELRNKPLEGLEVSVYFVLYGYANAKPTSTTAKLISFSQLVGGQAYYEAFKERAVQPLAKKFGSKLQLFTEAAKLLEGTPQTYGDYSAKIFALPLVPLTIVLWVETEEFSASADILFDSSANSFLTTEELAGLGGLTSIRLKHAVEVLMTEI